MTEVNSHLLLADSLDRMAMRTIQPDIASLLTQEAQYLRQLGAGWAKDTMPYSKQEHHK